MVDFSKFSYVYSIGTAIKEMEDWPPIKIFGITIVPERKKLCVRYRRASTLDGFTLADNGICEHYFRVTSTLNLIALTRIITDKGNRFSCTIDGFENFSVDEKRIMFELDETLEGPPQVSVVISYSDSGTQPENRKSIAFDKTEVVQVRVIFKNREQISQYVKDVVLKSKHPEDSTVKSEGSSFAPFLVGAALGVIMS
jgi:hypothetical protein